MASAFMAGRSLLLSFHFGCECFAESAVNSCGMRFAREVAFYHFSPRWSQGPSKGDRVDWATKREERGAAEPYIAPSHAVSRRR